jgi:hypothetical protein
VPYISAEMLDRKDPDHLNVTGMLHDLYTKLADSSKQVISCMIQSLVGNFDI